MRPALFVAGSLMMLVASGIRAANAWPLALASFTTAAPLALQVTVAVALGLVGLALQGTVVGLALGAMPRRLAGGGRLAEREALQLGVAAGFFGAAIATGRGALRLAEWARVPDVDAAGAVFPILQAAIGCVAWSAGRDCRRPVGVAPGRSADEFVDAEEARRNRAFGRHRDCDLWCPRRAGGSRVGLRRSSDRGWPARRLRDLVPP